jgi:hypothetical protein
MARVVGLALLIVVCVQGRPAAQGSTIPRMPDGRPNFQGIWQVRNRASYDLQDHVARLGEPAGRGVVVGGEIPYQPWAAKKKAENFANRATADPLAQCYMPGVPRIMYMEWPFQIFQTREHVTMTFEWTQVYRLIYTNGSPHPDGLEWWMGDLRATWEGDTLVVNVATHNDRTWFDKAGNFHSEAMRVVERYTMLDADTIQYEATIEDAKVFTRPWTIRMPLHRHKTMDRVLEYQCRAEMEEANGDFEREPRTWYTPPAAVPADASAAAAGSAAPPPRATATGVPDLTGFFQADHGGANWGLEEHKGVDLTPPGRGVVIDPPDKKLPYQPWGRAEQRSRDTLMRGYDDPTAHCFAPGIPRAFYTPSPFQIIQTPDYVIFLHERMAWRTVSLNRRTHLPDHMRLWMGDSLGRWEGRTLVVESANFNGKMWLNEVGDVVSHAMRVVERFTPVDANTINYEATVTDPLVYTSPWTIALPFRRQKSELLEVACLEDNQDLPHLKDVRDAERAKIKAAGEKPSEVGR